MTTREQRPTAPAGEEQLRADAERKARNAWQFYRIMAFITGVMLLLLTAEMILIYLVQVGPEIADRIRWIPFVHGWIYVIYVVSVFNLWSMMRWGLGRMFALVLAGVVPVLSFVMEHRAKSWFEADLAAVVDRHAAR